MKHRQLFRSEYPYIEAWKTHITTYPATPAPPAAVIARFGGRRPKCNQCWDTGLCPECLGIHPQYCPAPECGGYCTCNAGRARRAAYEKSLSDYGLR